MDGWTDDSLMDGRGSGLCYKQQGWQLFVVVYFATLILFSRATTERKERAIFSTLQDSPAIYAGVGAFAHLCLPFSASPAQPKTWTWWDCSVRRQPSALDVVPPTSPARTPTALLEVPRAIALFRSLLPRTSPSPPMICHDWKPPSPPHPIELLPPLPLSSSYSYCAPHQLLLTPPSDSYFPPPFFLDMDDHDMVDAMSAAQELSPEESPGAQSDQPSSSAANDPNALGVSSTGFRRCVVLSNRLDESVADDATTDSGLPEHVR